MNWKLATKLYMGLEVTYVVAELLCRDWTKLAACGARNCDFQHNVASIDRVRHIQSAALESELQISVLMVVYQVGLSIPN